MDKEKRRPPKGKKMPSITQLWKDLRDLKNRVESMATSLSSLKEMLNTTDNWHRRISGMIGKQIRFLPDSQNFGDLAPEPLRGTLLYSDRYTIGVEMKANTGQIRLYNKGKIEYVELAE